MASTDAAAANPTMSMAEAIVTIYGQFNTWPFYLLVLVVSLSFSRLAEIPVSWLRRRPSSRPAGNEAGLRAAQPQAPHVYHCCIEALQPPPYADSSANAGALQGKNSVVSKISTEYFSNI
ncbi:hypothetical protein TMEN_5412 [Trichophyton mentagrophytes]|uniref:Uncharacterized protein n=1 Tax=Trichophyton interdigitale (strain MR816) TaxID=1215338 RepID=A0A059JHK3_TRIIM|nr:hypothetical protein H101_08106 [Trichophyton interdigitale H6]KDB27249.1 hypothetical protein H109_00962 [Trichophyton interdigitale MR816]GBF62832.1 hypothetical protein TMEN_5412 [Trichophyton mentagrophytes]